MAEPEQIENLEWLFSGDTSDLESAHAKANALSDAQVAKSAATQAAIQTQHNLTSSIVQREEAAVSTKLGAEYMKRRTMAEDELAIKTALAKQYGLNAANIRISPQEIARVAPTLVSLESNRAANAEIAAQAAIRAEYGITSSIIQRNAKELENRAATAVISGDKISGAEKLLAAEFGITSSLIQRQAKELASTIPMADNVMKAALAASQQRVVSKPGMVQAVGPSGFSGPTLASFNAMSQLEEQLAKDRTRWAGDAVRNAETIALSRATIASSTKVAERAGLDLVKAERAIGAATKDTAAIAAASAAEFAGFSGSTSMLSGALAFLVSPLGLVTAGLALIVGAGALATATLFSMASGASAWGSRLADMSDKTGVTVNNLLVLDTAAKSSGSSLERLVNSIGILERRLGNADAATDRVSKGLKKWGIDAQDPNKALEQIIAKLGEFPEGVRRTQVAMDVFGIAGKDFAGITKVMHGNMVTYREELAKMGIELGGNSVGAAQRFNESQVKLAQQWEVIKFKIQSAATPIVENWLKGISDWLAKNQKDIIAWGETFVNVIATIARETKDFAEYLYRAFVNPVVVVFKAVYEDFKTIGKMTGISGENAAGQEAVPRSEWSIFDTPARSIQYDESKEAAANRAKLLKEGKVGPYLPGEEPKEPENPFARNPKGGGGGGGPDPAQHALRMEQERLRQTLEGYAHEEYQWESMFKNKAISMEQFTIKAMNLEIARSKATLGEESKRIGKITIPATGLMGELKAASELRKPDDRKYQTLKIEGQIAEEKNRLIEATDKLKADIDQEAVNRVKANEQAKNQVLEIMSRQQISRLDDYAQRRIVTEEQAAKQILQIELNLIDAKADLLETDLLQHTDQTSAEYLRLMGQLGAVEAERSAKVEEGQRSIKAARDRDLEDARQFVTEMRRLDEDIIASRMDTARALLETKISTGGMNNPNDQREARVAIERVNEAARHEAEVADLQDRARAELKQARTEQDLYRIFAINARYSGLIIAEAERNAATLKAIDAQRAADLHDALRGLAGTAANNISDSIAEGFEKGVGAGVRTFAAGLLEIVRGAAMRQLEERMLAIFDNLAGKGGIIGKIFEVITGVGAGKTEKKEEILATAIPRPTNIPAPIIGQPVIPPPEIPEITIPAPVIAQSTIPDPTIPSIEIPTPTIDAPVIPPPAVPNIDIPTPVIAQSTIPEPVIPDIDIPAPIIAKPTIPTPDIPDIKIPAPVVPEPVVTSAPQAPTISVSEPPPLPSQIPAVDIAATGAINSAKMEATITGTTAQQTVEMNQARAVQLKSVEAAVRESAEHLCACNKPQQEGFLSTILKAAVGAAVGSLAGSIGSGGGSVGDIGPGERAPGGVFDLPTGPGGPIGDELPSGPPITGGGTRSRTVTRGRKEGGNFGDFEEFDVGEHGPEKVYTNESGGFVVPTTSAIGTRSDGPKNINITLNAPVLGSSSHSAPRSRREYLEMLGPALREALG